MKNVLKTILGIIIGLFVISGLFKLIGAVFNLTFGVLGAAIAFVCSIIINPITIVIALAIAVYLMWRRRQNA